MQQDLQLGYPKRRVGWVLLTMTFALTTFGWDSFPIGVKNDLPVLPREATTHEEQQIPKDPRTSWYSLCRIACAANLGVAEYGTAITTWT